MSAALIAPMPCADQAELLRAVRPADRAHAGRRGPGAHHRRARRDQGRRRRALRRDPLGSAAPRRARPRPVGRDRGRVRGRERGGRPDRHGRAAHLHRAPLARPRGQRGAGRDRGEVPRRGPDGLGPRGAGSGLPGSARPRPGLRGGPCQRPADDDPCRGVGRRRAGPPCSRGGAGTGRPRPGHDRRSGAVRGTARPRHHARPVPDLELAGGHRPVGRGPPARADSTAPACR